MPVDPQVQAFLEAQEQAAIENQVPPIAEQTVEMARAGYLAVAEMLGQGPDVDADDSAVPGPAGDIPVRIYRPRDGSGSPLRGVAPGAGEGAGAPSGRGDPPILVYYHGGGWVIGDLDTHDYACRELSVGAGCIVVAVDYRLAPEAQFPAAVDDSWAALQWVAANAESLGGDPARIAVGGDSAGGNLSAVMSLLARDNGGPALAFQLLVYPAVDMEFSRPSIDENADGYVLTKDHMIWFRGHYLRSDADRADFRASPLLAADHSGLPPALVVTAEFDPLRDEGRDYAEKLQAAGVEATLSNYEGQIHVFFQLSPILDGGRRAVDEACAALRGAFADSP